MSLKYKYVLFIGVLHCILTLLIYAYLKDNKWYFIAAELGIFLSLYLSYLLYKAFIKPIELLQSGTDAIKDEDFSIKYLKTGSHEMDKLVSIFNEMIDKLRVERTNTTEQSYFINNLIEASPLGIAILDFDGKFSSINPAGIKLLGIKSEWRDKNLIDFPSALNAEIRQLEVGQAKVITINGIDKYKCQINEVIHQGFKRKFILIDDLSKQILQSEKEAYGTIIRMMAHEVNNSMGAINSILDTVVEFGFEEDKNLDLKNSLILAKDRNHKLSKFMANYASILRLPKANRQKVDLCTILKKTGQLFLSRAKEADISIEFDLPENPVFIFGDEILLEQAISNMLKNAIESIVQDGDIVISCALKPRCFCISDNGKGILPEEEANLFKPFFSTKTNGQGIGLMLIRDILQDHDCQFSLTTDSITKLTNFKVCFDQN